MGNKFAFILMGPHYDPDEHKAVFVTPKREAHMLAARSLDEAKTLAAELAANGFGAIELCGAFGEAGCQAIIDATGGKVAVGYITHFPEQDELFANFFK